MNPLTGCPDLCLELPTCNSFKWQKEANLMKWNFQWYQVGEINPNLLIFVFPNFCLPRFSEYIIICLGKSLPRWTARWWIIPSWHSCWYVRSFEIVLFEAHDISVWCEPISYPQKRKSSLRVDSWLRWGLSNSMKKILVISACCIWKNRWTKCKNMRQQRQSDNHLLNSGNDLIVVVRSTEVWFH